MVNASVPVITPAQLRAARAWLQWSQDELSDRSGVSKRSIARYEQGKTVPHSETLTALQRTFEATGVHFEFVGMAGKGIGTR
ncbi:MAG: helix-turn-helix transcriptional regulator [Xanthobacteraceae bacterium]|jgi:transcriptional regulator with XRE-family HTH domain